MRQPFSYIFLCGEYLVETDEEENMLAPELYDTNAWATLNDTRRDAIIADTLRGLPDFALAYVKTYSGPPDAGPPLAIATLRQQSTGLLFNLIPGGNFSMGFSERQREALRHAVVPETQDSEESEESESCRRLLSDSSDMLPVHTVRICPFLLARFPLSKSEAAQLLKMNIEDENIPRLEDLEVAGFFEHELNGFFQATGYQLPSEAQWEYACRAGSDSLFWWGDRLPQEMEWTEELDNESETDRCSNRFGLVNVAAYSELCADQWHDDYTDAPTDGSAWTEGGDGRRIARGGAALLSAWQGVGEWLMMLSAVRMTDRVYDIGNAIRPSYPLPNV